MSILTKEFHFTSDAEGWTPTAGDIHVNQAWKPQRNRKTSHGGRHNPPLSIMGGSLRTTARRGSTATTNYWQWEGTWEELDTDLIGGTIVSVQADYQWRVDLRDRSQDRNSDATWSNSEGGGGGGPPAHVFYITGNTDGASQDYDLDPSSPINGRDAYLGVTDSAWQVFFDGSEYIVYNAGANYYVGQSGSVPAAPWEETVWKADKGTGDITVTQYVGGGDVGTTPFASGPFELVLGGAPVDTFSSADYVPPRGTGDFLVYPPKTGDNSATFTSPTWQRVIGTNLTVGPAYQPSASTIGFRLSTITPAVADDVKQWARIKQDYVVLTITYIPGIPDTRKSNYFFTM